MTTEKWNFLNKKYNQQSHRQQSGQKMVNIYDKSTNSFNIYGTFRNL